MKKYSRKLLSDYLLGKSIDDYDIDELESNPEFIKEIIDFSNDKSMYNLCDDELKKNFNLMKFEIIIGNTLCSQEIADGILVTGFQMHAR